MQRRALLKFLALSGVLSILPQPSTTAARRRNFVEARPGQLGFTPVSVPVPVPPQMRELSRFELPDALTLPPEYTYDIVCSWGERVFINPVERFGYNNDFTAFIPLKADDSEGLLWVNHEYISAKPWLDTYSAVVGQPLPGLAALQQGNPLAETDKLRLAREVLVDQGGSILHLRRDRKGRYRVVPRSKYNRRISGISGLEDPGQRLVADGPAVEIFERGGDGLGRQIVGTFANCSGGVTPWGTILSCEENYQNQVGERVSADGLPVGTSAFASDNFPDNAAAHLGLQANKYGWVVEIDPRDPDAPVFKHTALGRFRHENVAIRAQEGKPLVCYMGDDRTGGHTYKYVSRKPYRARARTNSELLADGTLYVARYNPDGTGQWLALIPETPVDPPNPEQLAGGILRLPQREGTGLATGGADTPEQIARFKQRFRTLGDLYTSQGAILIDAFLAANAIGGTPTARPEDLEVHPGDGSVFIAFTSGAKSPEGGPDTRIFTTASRTDNKIDSPPHGAIYRLAEVGGEDREFTWSAFATSGELASGGKGFANPDNLCFDGQYNLWICSDIGNQNQPVPERANASDTATSGLFGSNTLWFLPTEGALAGVAYPFATAPSESELTGPCFTGDGRTLFLAVQHPGEQGGWRQGSALKPETRYQLLSADGKRTFEQTRQVPVGSNFPDPDGKGPPRPSVIAIRSRP